jgi:hypothetical protein
MLAYLEDCNWGCVPGSTSCSELIYFDVESQSVVSLLLIIDIASDVKLYEDVL